MHFLFSHKHPLIKRWNKAIRRNVAFIQRTFRKYFSYTRKTGKVPRCPRAEQEISEASKPLSKLGYKMSSKQTLSDITSTFGIFFVLIVGLAISILSFLLEWIVKFFWKKVEKLPRSKEQRHLTEPWSILNKANTFYVQDPIFIIQQKPLIPKWWLILNRSEKVHRY